MSLSILFCEPCAQAEVLVITPHITFDSAVERILDTTVANIKAFRNGTPQNQVHT